MWSFLIKLKNLKDVCLDILFPPQCLNCGAKVEGKNFLCDSCASLIKINGAPFCPVCRRRLASGSCRHKNQPSYMLAAAGNYDDEILKTLIHYFKYENFKNLAPILGEILIKHIEDSGLKIENFAIAPVPLYPRRQRVRGFNQAELLAKFVSQKLNVEFCDVLIRIKSTRPQAKLKNEKRKQNVQNCFSLKNPDAVKGRNIILVDDVFTSGATMNEAVKILKQNGVKKIIALVLAKA